MVKKKILLAVLAAAFIAAPVAAHAENRTIWQILFPYMVKQPDPKLDPVATGKAPFEAAAEEITTTSAAKPLTDPRLDGLYSSASDISLDQPHLHQDEVSSWLVRAVSEILSLSADEFDEHLKHLATGMDETALTAFKSFIETNQLLTKMHDNNLQMNSFVEEVPLLLNQGPVDGRYRWLFEMPVTLTFVQKGQETYEDHDASLNQRVSIVVQVGRVPKGEGVDQMMIESFTMRNNAAADAEAQ